jgi:hypothetical protein
MKEDGANNGLEMDMEAGKYEKFPVVCRTCQQEFTYNSPKSMFNNDAGREAFRQKIAEDFECEYCKKSDVMKRIANQAEAEKQNSGK